MARELDAFENAFENAFQNASETCTIIPLENAFDPLPQMAEFARDPSLTGSRWVAEMGRFPARFDVTCWGCNADQLPKVESTKHACGNCRVARYCSRSCQKKDWAAHKAVCSFCAEASRDMRGAVARPWSCPAVLPHLSHSPECLGYLRSATPISTASSGNPWAFTSLRRTDTMREHIWRRGSLLWEKRQWIEWQKENWEAAEVIGRTLYSPQRLLAFFQKAGQIVTEPLSGRLLVGDLTAAEVRQLSTSAAQLGVSIFVFCQLSRRRVAELSDACGEPWSDDGPFQSFGVISPGVPVATKARRGVPGVVQLGLAPAAGCWELNGQTWRRRARAMG